ncbi:MAG: hypothetical protein AAF787_03330 [Chloroflexota bacterium]
MSEQGSASGTRNIVIVALVALVVAAIVLLGLYLQARSMLREEALLATAAVEQADADAATSQASFDSLQQTSEAIAIAATEAAETAVAEVAALEEDVDSAEADIADLREQSTQAAGTAVAEVDALGTQVAIEAGTATRSALIAVSTQERAAFQLQRDAATAGAVAAAGTRDVAAAQATDTRQADIATREAATAAAQVLELEAQAAQVEESATDVAARATIAAELNAIDASVAEETAVAAAEVAEMQETELADMSDMLATQSAADTDAQAQMTQAAVAMDGMATEVAELNDQQATQETLLGTQAAQLEEQATEMAATPTPTTEAVTPQQEPTEAPLVTVAPSGTELPPSAQTGDTTGIEASLSTLSILPRDLSFIDGIDSFAFDLANEDNVIVGEPFVSTYGDFVTAATMAWGDGAEEDYCGFIFRRDETGDNYYTVEIDRRGSVRFFIRADGEWLPGESTPSSNAVLTGLDDLNDLILVAQESSFVFFVNGEEVLEMVDETHSESGGVSIMSGTFEGSDESGCTFTNAGIWDLTAPVKQ